MSSPFNILQQSPHDFAPPRSETPGGSPPVTRWIPSRYTVRATTEDGQLILWNTLNGSMSVFKAAQAPTIKTLLSRTGFDHEPKGLAKYLVDRGFLVSAETNEYRRLQLEFGQQHYRTDALQFILLASEDCNFRCQYCYEDFTRGTMQPWVRTGIKNLVKNKMDSLRSLHVSWFGGEPLYGLKAIEDLAPFFVQTAEENSIIYHGSMTTNGYLLTPEVADKLLEWKITSYQITIDGSPEDHDRNRPTRDGKGTFATIFQNLQAMKQRPEDYLITIRVNFDRQNSSNMNQFFDLVESEFRDDSRFKVRFHAVGRWGGSNDANLDVCGFDEVTDVKRSLEKEARQRGLDIGRGLRDINRFGSEVCYAARPYHFVIGATGKVMKCTVALDKQDHNVVGNITEDGNLNLDPDKFSLWTEPAFQNDKKCQKCVVVPICQGIHCPLVRIENGESPCTSVRLNLKHALRTTYDTAEDTTRKVPIGSHPSDKEQADQSQLARATISMARS
jgi:uncharacterized protein